MPDYALRDTGENAITPSPRAVDAGCAELAPNALTCPVSAITSFDVLMHDRDDSVLLSGAQVPTLVDGFAGDDALLFTGSGANETYTIAPSGSGSARTAASRTCC